MNQESLSALDKLAHLPNTTTAVLSGRHLEGLQRVCAARAFSLAAPTVPNPPGRRQI